MDLIRMGGTRVCPGFSRHGVREKNDCRGNDALSVKRALDHGMMFKIVPNFTK
jgi:hypothetical protein